MLSYINTRYNANNNKLNKLLNTFSCPEASKYLDQTQFPTAMSTPPRRSNSTCPRPGSSGAAQPFPRTPSRNNGRRPSQNQQTTPERREDWRASPRNNTRRPSQNQQSTPNPRVQQTPQQQTPPSFNRSASFAQRTTPDARPGPRRPSDQRTTPGTRQVPRRPSDYRTPPNNSRSAPRRPSANNWSGNNRSSPQSGPSPNNRPPGPDEAATKKQINQTYSITMMASPANPLPFPLPIPLGIAMLLVGSSKSGK